MDPSNMHEKINDINSLGVFVLSYYIDYGEGYSYIKQVNHRKNQELKGVFQEDHDHKVETEKGLQKRHPRERSKA